MIATLRTTRSPVLTNLATASKQGLADFDACIWWGLCLPKGTPADIVQRLNEAAMAMLDAPSVRNNMKSLGVDLAGLDQRSPDALRWLVENEVKKWAAPIRASGIASVRAPERKRRAMKPSMRKIGDACGAEIDFDLSKDFDDRTFRQIEDAFHDNIVVYFRDQKLSNERHIEFSRRFGELEIHVVKKYLLPDYPEILLISNIKTEAGEHIGLADAGFTWHTDVSYVERPSRCSLLYSKEVPVRDGKVLGDTVFTNTRAAYEALPEAMKRRLAGLKAIHRYSARARIANSPRPKLTKQQLDATPDIAHPIVRTHFATGLKALYVTAGECVAIEGMPNDEAVALIGELHDHCLKPEFQYRHKWQVGDLLMWDNAASMHLAICDYQLPERRLMHRTTVVGEVPF